MGVECLEVMKLQWMGYGNSPLGPSLVPIREVQGCPCWHMGSQSRKRVILALAPVRSPSVALIGQFGSCDPSKMAAKEWADLIGCLGLVILGSARKPGIHRFI